MIWILIILSSVSVSVALWPAFPSHIAGGIPLTGRGNFKQVTGQQRNTFSYPKGPIIPERSQVNRLCNCKNEVQAVDARIRSEHSLVERLQIKVDDLSNIVYNLRSVVQDYNLQDRRNVEERLSQQFGQSIIVSFSARVRANKSFLGPTAAIVFDEIIVNNGEAYDPYSGVFTAPVDGVYHFASTVLSGFNSTIETMLMVNGEEVGRMFSGAFLSRGSGTNNVLLNLKEDDEVSVNVFYGNGDYVHGLWSTFSGYLINPLY
ncbi:hypothetical protein SNE40_012957 [Patella caerulea]|uniref:C1q domain-containing protein n=1 Tax=Patella caerulea TaxID=87958 RepID=A0AAN8PT02_PATCE